ncbi:MAG: hypothetical protein Q8S94_14185 [Pseudohongiella sp.]|nr:hypothetical protein [Pseudohongiella sp.]
MFKTAVLLGSVTLSAMSLFYATASTAASTAVTIALCPLNDPLGGPANPDASRANVDQIYFTADGTRQWLSISQHENASQSCSTAVLQVEGDILWAAPATEEQVAGAIRQVGLLGDFTNNKPLVSEIIVIPENTSEAESEVVTSGMALTSALPLDRPALYQFTSQHFGLDERVVINESTHLFCEPGENIAGAFFTSERVWSIASELQLEIRARGQGQFQVALGDTQRDKLQEPLRLGEMVLTDSATEADALNFRFNVPDNNSPWTSLTIICPDEGGELELLSLNMSTPQGRQQREQFEQQLTQGTHRGAWLWSPQLWQQTPEFIWRAQTLQQLNEIYISVPLDNTGDVADTDMLMQFLTNANNRGLDVWVVIGDPRDVLPASLPALEARLNAFLRYNQQAPVSARLHGVQLDIEPYLLRGFAGAQSYWRDRYVSVINHAHALLQGRMPLDLVMPAWWGSHRAWGQQLFEQLPVVDIRLSIMNYHTSIDRLRANAQPFLEWGQRASVPVMIALESGALPDETHHRYTHNKGTGELWLVMVGEESVFVLFDRLQSDLTGQAFAFNFNYPVPAGDYTFKGDMARLNSVANKLIHEWHTWPAFSGIAIHGLDDIRVGEDVR